MAAPKDLNTQIPLLDLQQGFSNNAKQLHQAFKEFGFCYIRGHNISADMQKELYDSAQNFFSQSLQQKKEIAMENAGLSWRGYFPAGAELTKGLPDLKEGIYFGSEHPASHPNAHLPMHGSNLWPSGKRFQNLPNLIRTYMRQLEGLSSHLMHLVAQGLGLSRNYFSKQLTNDPTCLFRIFNYPANQSPELWGVGPHTDMGLLTVLLQDELGGLQIQARSGEWIDAPPIPGTFIINIGDMLQHQTHGIYHATLHRVKNTAGQDRLSFPFFYDPNWQVPLTPIPQKLLRDSELEVAKQDPVNQRWDGLDLSSLPPTITYGGFVWEKIKEVFPHIAAAASQETGK